MKFTHFDILVKHDRINIQKYKLFGDTTRELFKINHLNCNKNHLTKSTFSDNIK